MVAVRCIRCGNPVEGTSQLCASCAADKKTHEAAAREAAVKATTNLCPNCKQEIPRAAQACPNCSRSFARDGAKLVPYVRADFVVRLVAFLVDSIGFGLVAGFAIVASGASLAAGLTFAYLGWLAFQLAFWLTLGATPGKLLMGIRIVTVDGERLAVSHCVLRALAHLVINTFGNILYLLILIKEDKRGIEDMMSGTMVVYRDTIPKATAAGAASA